MKRPNQPQKAQDRRDPAHLSSKRVTLPRALSKLGFCSRTQAEKLVMDARVSINGVISRDISLWVDMETERIAVDDVLVTAEAKIYVMLNKPRGLLTTRDDPQGRATVYDCLKEFDGTFLSPVGRLDKASEGLLLFTNDTQFAQAMLDPATHVAKIYHVQVDRIPDPDMLDRMTTGILAGDDLLQALSATLLRAGEKNAWLEIKLDEGKNRHIRRMLEELGIECRRLIRVQIGDLPLGDLQKGAVRRLTDSELKRLRQQASMKN